MVSTLQNRPPLKHGRWPVFIAGIFEREECDQWLVIFGVPAGKGSFGFRVGSDRLCHGIQQILDMGFILCGIAAVAGKDAFAVKADDGDLHTGLFLQRSSEDAANGDQIPQSKALAV